VVAGALAGRRTVLLIGLLVAGLLVAGAALIGIEYRYRFPLDPLINVLATGGLLTIPTLVRAGWRRVTPGQADRPIPTPAGTTS
jgi:hypothetical protein